MPHGETKSGRRAVIEDVHCVTLEVECVGEGFERAREAVEVVGVVTRGRDDGEAEAGQVGRDDVVTVGEPRDEMAVLEGRGGEAVQQKNDGSVGGACFAVEDGDAVGLDAMDGCEGNGGVGGLVCSFASLLEGVEGCVCLKNLMLRSGYSVRPGRVMSSRMASRGLRSLWRMAAICSVMGISTP